MIVAVPPLSPPPIAFAEFLLAVAQDVFGPEFICFMLSFWNLRPLWFLKTLPIFLVPFTLLGQGLVANANQNQKSFEIPPSAHRVIQKLCLDCHGAKGEGNISLVDLDKLQLTTRLDLLNKVQDQFFYKLMPPATENQPSAEDRAALSGWLRTELRRHNASKLDERLAYPAAGNYVDHDLLFSGQLQAKPFTPARRWLVSPQIFHERVRDSLGLEGKNRETRLFGVLSPFTLPERSGIRDYDSTPLDGSHFVVMQTNATWLANKVVGSLQVKYGEPLENVIDNPKQDKWLPVHTFYEKPKGPTMPAFDLIVAKKSPATDEELVGAIEYQFSRVLQRAPTAAEKAKYLKLTRSVVDLAGNIAGLRKMLETVWLESEFVYRLEFGEGEPDADGRKLLSPREAAYAIAYALGDKSPDAELLKAANEGRLHSKADFEREVRRLLAGNSLTGVIDPAMLENGLPNPLTISPQPKIVRFFRDFFGYPLALRVFKDVERSDGYYNNPGRGSSQTPGHLVREADMVVNFIVQQDQNVFENLLTTDKFIVAPTQDAAKRIDALNEVYEHFKDKNWHVKPGDKKPPKWLSEEELAYLRKRLHYNSSERDLGAAMAHTEHFKKKNLDPHPVWNYPFGIHMLTPHARSYNISPPEWQYPREQPFEVEHRKGILTHPAWLIAHSQNSATDPVRRGKWIREKLLAGVVPDVPITVDAVIPEHADKTLRERLDLATNKQQCAKCHNQMNPLGVAFEIFDDFGRYRTLESLEHPDNLLAMSKTKYGADTFKTAPVVAHGKLHGTGDPQLDGDVKDAFELIDRLAKSERVRQSMIRHAFRYYLGRNEMLSDSPTLIDADRAYVENGGSFKAVIVSLLTSDSFLYRK